MTAEDMKKALGLTADSSGTAINEALNQYQQQQWQGQHQGVCPSCGRCPACGRGYGTLPVYPYYPYPHYPYWYGGVPMNNATGAAGNYTFGQFSYTA